MESKLKMAGSYKKDVVRETIKIDKTSIDCKHKDCIINSTECRYLMHSEVV